MIRLSRDRKAMLSAHGRLGRALLAGTSTSVLLAIADPTTAAGTAPVPLSGAAIKEIVSGATVHLGTPLGIPLPLTFQVDGTVTGTAGKLTFYLGSATDRGKWWVANGRLCQKWARWFDSETRCMQISRDGARFHWSSDDGKSGTAQIVAKTPAAVPQLLTDQAKVAPRPGHVAPRQEVPIVVPKPVLVVEREGPLRPLARPAAIGHQTAAPSQEASPVPTTGFVRPASAPRLQRYRVVGVRTDDVLNVRALPSAQSLVLGTISAGAENVSIVGICTRGWCRIRFGEIEGWANATFLQSADPSPPADH